MGTVILLRHGESTWNAEGLFTGWVDVPLSATGTKEATAAGQLLADAGARPGILYTSVLTRSVQTANLALEAAGWQWLPVRRSWRLNERHYGALQGKDKAQTRREFGDEQFMLWRRSYDVPPPALEGAALDEQQADPRYALLGEASPRTECLKDVVERLLPYWQDVILGSVAAGQTVLIVAHGNSLRALVKHLDGMSEDAIVALNIPTAVPLVYEFGRTLKPTRHYYLGDAAKVAAAAAAVASQTKA